MATDSRPQSPSPQTSLVHKVPGVPLVVKHSFATFAATAVYTALKSHSAIVNCIGGTMKLLQKMKEIARMVLGGETMIIIEIVLNTLHSILPPDCTILKLSTTLFTLIMCQLRTGPHTIEPGRPYQSGEDTRVMQLFSRFSLYASAVYCAPRDDPPLGEAAPTKAMTIEEKNLLIEDDIGLDPTRIYPYVDDIEISGLARLEHFVAVDDECFRVVLSIKGTYSIEAILKNLDAKYVKVRVWGETYEMHRGMWKAAKDFLQATPTLRNIQNELRAHPNYSLAIIGHSLGGGVAALVAVFLSQPTWDGRFETNDRTIEGRDVECFTFGSAASMDQALGERTKPMIYSLVNGYDVVPYLSMGVVEDFCEMSNNIWEEPGRLIGMMRDVLIPETSNTVLSEHLMYLRGSAKRKRLVPPGRVWVIVYNQDGEVEDVEEVMDVPERFGYISMRQKLRLIRDHMIHGEDSIESKLEPFCL